MESVSVRTARARSEPRAKSSTVLFIPAGDPDIRDRVLPGTMLLGLPLLRRSVFAAHRARCGQILVITPDPAEVTPLLDGAPATVLMLGEPMQPLSPGRIVLLVTNVLPDPKWLQTLLEMPMKPGQLYVDGEAVAVADVVDAGAILSLVSSSRRPREVFAGLARAFSSVNKLRGQGGRIALTTRHDVRTAEDWLLRGLVKETEGFMSRYVERRISLAITRRLVSTRISPNTMTAVSVGIGLLAAPFFLSSRPAVQLAGALLFLLHSILDGCDGELARLTFQESRWGGLLDFWGDNVVHAAVFLCMAVGWSLAIQAAWPLFMGGAAIAGALGSAAFVYRHTMRAKDADGPLFTSIVEAPGPGLSRLLDALARRDFIYLVVLLSVLGKASWFLVLAGVGAPIFFLLLVWTARGASQSKGRVS